MRFADSYVARRAHPRIRRPVCLAAVLAFAVPLAIRAQATLSVTASFVTVPVPSATEYGTGYTLLGQLDYQVVNCSVSNGATCTMGLWATTGTFGNRPIDQVQWQAAGTGVWHPLALLPDNANVAVINTPASSGTIYFRAPLAWTQEIAPQTLTAGLRLALAQR